MWKLFLSDLDLELYTDDPGGVGKGCAVYLKRTAILSFLNYTFFNKMDQTIK
jgi:hypothetical protein